MTTPYRGYSEIPGSVTPDVPYRVNLALREIDADIDDTVKDLEKVDQAQAGRLAALESAAGFGSGMKLQDDAVRALLLNADSATAKHVHELVSNEGPAAVVAQLDVPASPVREAFDEFTEQHIADSFHGPLKVWGDALRNQDNAPAMWVNLGSSTANGGNTTNFGFSWVGRIATWLCDRDILHDAVRDLESVTARQPNGVQVYNGAVGGTTSANYVNTAKIAAIKLLKPHLITHMVGANDLGQGVALSTYKNNLRNWMDQLQAASPESVHVYIHQQSRVAASPKIAWRDYGKAMREVADAYPNVVFFDASEDFRFKSGLAQHLISDDLHMNNAGHGLMAERVAEFLGHPFPKVETELVRGTTGGSVTTTTDTAWGTVTVPAAPYLRMATCHFSAYAYGTGTDGKQGPEMSVFGEYTDTTPPTRAGDAQQIRMLHGGVGRALTYSTSVSYYVDANRPFQFVASVGPSVYISGSAAYRDMHAVVQPA